MSLHIVFEQPGILDQGTKLRTRRAHTKSRQGCKSCRLRRIKCDEAKPDCSQCIEKAVSCEYRVYASVSCIDPNKQTAEVKAANRSILKELMLDFLHEVAPSCPNFINPIYKPEDDLTLLDHFLDWSESWLGSQTFQIILQQHAVQWSMEHPHLLQAILAIAAAHLHTLNPDQTHWRIATAFHYNHALRLYLARFQDGLEHDEAEGIFATGYLLLLVDMSGVLDTYDETIQQQNDAPASKAEQKWFSLKSACGLATLFESPVMAGIFEQSVWKSFQEEWLHLKWLQSPRTHLGPVRPAENSMVKAIEAAIDGLEDEATSICRRSIWVLGELSLDDTKQGRSANMITWLATLPGSYLQFLQEQSTVAELGIAAWCTLALQVDQWWITPFAQKLMKSIQQLAISRKELCGQNDRLLGLLGELTKEATPN